MTQQDTQPPAETLAECPFCGGSAQLMGFNAPEFWVSCLRIGCKAGTESFGSKERAVAAWNRRTSPALTRRAGGDAIPNSWSRSAEDTRAMALLLAEVELHLQSSRIFITTREKMHPCGVDLHDELAVKVTAALDNLGREDGDARR